MKKMISIFVGLILVVGWSSCSKKRGCNDENACNFDPSAGKYDGSCVYYRTWYHDPDGDGLGDPNVVLNQCEQPVGYVNNANGAIREIATNYIGLDCSGVAYNFFDEMDANKIIVMAMVMPCASCITDPVAALSIVQGYASSHPGRVVMYVVDDYGDTDCSVIEGWSNAFGLSQTTKFSDPAIKMSDYGTAGMPKMVVMGGPNHYIYYNENETTVGLQAAINQALLENP
jgi:hypothetical protein